MLFSLTTDNQDCCGEASCAHYDRIHICLLSSHSSNGRLNCCCNGRNGSRSDCCFRGGVGRCLRRGLCCSLCSRRQFCRFRRFRGQGSVPSRSRRNADVVCTSALYVYVLFARVYVSCRMQASAGLHGSSIQICLVCPICKQAC